MVAEYNLNFECLYINNLFAYCKEEVLENQVSQNKCLNETERDLFIEFLIFQCLRQLLKKPKIRNVCTKKFHRQTMSYLSLNIVRIIFKKQRTQYINIDKKIHIAARGHENRCKLLPRRFITDEFEHKRSSDLLLISKPSGAQIFIFNTLLMYLQTRSRFEKK